MADCGSNAWEGATVVRPAMLRNLAPDHTLVEAKVITPYPPAGYVRRTPLPGTTLERLLERWLTVLQLARFGVVISQQRSWKVVDDILDGLTVSVTVAVAGAARFDQRDVGRRLFGFRFADVLQ